VIQITSAKNHRITAALGIAATLPLVFFVTSNVLKYELGFLPEWQVPLIHPAILIGGVLVAIIVNAWSIFDIVVSSSGRKLNIAIEITADAWNLTALILACVFFAVMIMYLFVENVLGAIGA